MHILDSIDRYVNYNRLSGLLNQRSVMAPTTDYNIPASITAALDNQQINTTSNFSNLVLLASQQYSPVASYTSVSLLDTNISQISADHTQDLSSITTDPYHCTKSSSLYGSEPSIEMATTILSSHENVSDTKYNTDLLDPHEVVEQSNMGLDGSLFGHLCNESLSLRGGWRPNYSNISTTDPYSHDVAPLMNSTGIIGSIASSPVSYVENALIKGKNTTDAISSHVKTSMSKKKTRKRKRLLQNIEDMENQRMTHIAVERNRRKQMNQHLDVLRSMMPSSYIQRGDQASIVGATVRLVEELEQMLQSLRAQKLLRGYFMHSVEHLMYCDGQDATMNSSLGLVGEDTYAQYQSPLVTVEVKMLSISLMLVKVLVERRPHQLLSTLSALKRLFLNVIHLNVTTLDMTMLYSFNLEMEIKCPLQTPLEVATSIHQALDICREGIQ